MRILRIAAVVIFIAALALNILGNAKYKNQTDVTPPVISGSAEPLELSVEQGMTELTQGLTAQDAQDGDLTDKILVASTGHFVEKGTLNVKYVVFDKGNNVDTFERKVVFTDYRSPRIYLKQPLVFYRGDNIRVLSYVTANDCLEGDLSGKVQMVDGRIDQYDTSAVQSVVLEIANAYGDRVQVKVNLLVKPVTDVGPEIRLSEYITYIAQGEAFEPMDMILSVRAQGTHEELDVNQIRIENTVDNEDPGCYVLTYVYTHENHTSRVFLTVVVEGE